MRGSAGAAFAVVAALALAACSGAGSAAAPTGSTTPTTSTSAPTTSQSPTASAGPAGFGTLTGLPMATAAQLARPIVVVDVAVGPGRPFARGLNQADVVYQEFDNPGSSRLICAFQSTDAGSIGPVATTTPIDARVTSLMGLPVLAFAGGSSGFLKQVGPTVVTPRPSTSYPTLYAHFGAWLYTSTKALRASAPKAAPAPAGLITFGATTAGSPTAKKVTRIVVTVPGHLAQTWAWNGHVWVGPGGVQVTNVVLQIVPYKRLTPSKDPAVSSAIPIGTGAGVVVAGDESVAVAWFRRSLLSITNYLDGRAVAVPLLPGRSWIILAPTGSRATAS